MGYNILIVDDSMIIRRIVAKILKISNVEINEVFFAENGMQALQWLQEKGIDIVFADINMPVMNGIELIQEMSKKDLLRSIPVVVISSEHSRERIEALMALGVRAYIHKPFFPEMFTSVVKELLH